MRVPLSWIRELTPAEGSSEEIARTLSFLGLVVEGIREVPAPLGGVVVARVLGTRPHPAADRIQLVDVDPGDGEALQVCCGAFNMRPGDLVPLATIGTVMPGGTEIARRKMRGEWSNGMLCSAPELGVGPEGREPAIYIFPAGPAHPGQAAAEALGLGPDVVFDLEVSPNRSDCLSVAGVARDLAAALRLPFALPAPAHSVAPGVALAAVGVDPAATAACPRFTGTVIEGAQLATVPALVAWRLSLAGMRPVNPVVDVSNYVMLELGQPNHPYDLDRLGGAGLEVRRAGEGEILVTLDGTPRALRPDDLVVADQEGRAVGIAGIMGGADAEISASTTTVLLEVANFDSLSIAATGRRLGVSTEARARFERGVDIEVAELAVDRFVELLGPEVRRGETTDVRSRAPERRSVRLRTDRVNLVLGTQIAAEECAAYLTPLGFSSSALGEGVFDVTVPTWRPDCEREIDLVEEVARTYGYARIGRELPRRPVAAGGLSAEQKVRRQLRQLLVGAGASEAWTTTFLSPGDITGSGLDAGLALELENPLDRSEGLLRTCLLPGLLRSARFNTERQAGAVSLFELGSVFRRPSPPGQPDLVPGLVDGAREWEQLCLVAVGGAVDATYAVRAWEVCRRGLRLAGAALVPSLGAPLSTSAGPGHPGPGHPGPGRRPGGQATDRQGADRAGGWTGALDAWPSLHPGRRAVIAVGATRVGIVGELAPEISAQQGLPGRVAVLIADLAGLVSAPRLPEVARPVSRFPASDLDMAFVVDDEVSVDALVATVTEVAGDLAESVALFDTWRGPALGPGRRSLAIRARLRAHERTLTEAEVARARDEIAAAASERHGAQLRGVP